METLNVKHRRQFTRDFEMGSDYGSHTGDHYPPSIFPRGEVEILVEFFEPIAHRDFGSRYLHQTQH